MAKDGQQGWLRNIFYSSDMDEKGIKKNLSALEKNLKQARRKKDFAKQAYYLDQIGLLYIQKHDPKQALETWVEILTLYNRSKYRNVLAVTYSNMGIGYRLSNELDNAEKFLNKAATINKQLDYKPGLLVDNYNNAVLAIEKAQYEGAFEFIDQSLTLASELADSHWLSWLILLKSQIFYLLSQYRSALEGFEYVMDEAEKTKAADWVVSAMCGASLCYLDTGDYENAYSALEDALETADGSLQQANKALARAHMSDFYLRLGDVDKARKLAMEAKNLTNEEEDPHTTVFIYRLMASVNAKRGMSENSRTYLHQALEITRQCRDKVNEAYVMHDLVHLDFLEGKYREANNQAANASKMIASIRLKPLECMHHILIGRIYQAMGDNEKSFSHRERALLIAESTKIPDLIWLAHYNLGRLFHAHKELDTAYNHYRSAIDTLDFIASHLHSPALVEMFFKEKNRNSVLQDIVTLLISRGRMEEAQKYFDRIELTETKDKIKHLFKQ